MLEENAIHIGIKAYADKIEEVDNQSQGAYSNFVQDGSSYNTKYSVSDFMDIGLNMPSEITAPSKTKLLEQLKGNTDAVSKATLEIAKAQVAGNQIMQRLVQATESSGMNMFGAILGIATELTKGNKYSSVLTNMNQIVGETQVNKNLKIMDEIDFNTKGHLDLVDSKGNPIIPRNVKAINNAESAEHMAYLKTGEDSITDSDDNLIIPRQASAIKNAEKAIETKEMNDSTITEELGFLDEFFMGLDSFVEDVADDYLNDGFNFSSNPFENFFKILENDLDEEMNRIGQGV